MFWVLRISIRHSATLKILRNDSTVWLYAWLLSHVWHSVTLWTVAHQAPLFMGFSKQEYWSVLIFPSPGALPDPGIKPACSIFSKLASEFFTQWANKEALIIMMDKGKFLFLNVSALDSTNIWVYGTSLVAEMVKNLTPQQRLYFYLAIVFLSESLLPTSLTTTEKNKVGIFFFFFYLNSQH